METQILMYIFIAVFTITAGITLAGISGKLKMEEKYLKPLYRLLLLEVVAFILAFMTQSYLRSDRVDHARLASRAGLMGSVPAELDALETWLEDHFERSAEYEKVAQSVQDLNARYARLETECDRENACPNGFHQDLNDLINFLPRYFGSINLDFEPKEKEEVYLLLGDLLNQLERISKDDLYSDRAQTQPHYRRIRKAYLEFRRFYRGEDAIPEDEEYFILPSDIGFLLQEYANRLRN